MRRINLDDSLSGSRGVDTWLHLGSWGYVVDRNSRHSKTVVRRPRRAFRGPASFAASTPLAAGADGAGNQCQQQTSDGKFHHKVTGAIVVPALLMGNRKHKIGVIVGRSFRGAQSLRIHLVFPFIGEVLGAFGGEGHEIVSDTSDDLRFRAITTLTSTPIADEIV